LIRARAIAAALLVLAASLACSVPAEHVIVADYFAACRLRDLTALSKFATTVFEPRQQGTVSDFEIESVTPGRPDGESMTKDVAVKARVRTPDGRSVTKTLTVVLRKSAIEEKPALYGGWRVVSVRE
jgi:hypothetical protein